MPIDTSEGIVAVTISIGTATSGISGDTSDELVRAADSAMYRAKAAGRDRVVHAAFGEGKRSVIARPAAADPTTDDPMRQAG
jgi:predicted signal transduction protein with EAL and GGDEF domain